MRSSRSGASTCGSVRRAEDVKSALDFLLRFLFFAAAPPLLLLAAELFPITGAIAQLALALVVFFAAEAVKRATERWRVAGWALSDTLAFEAYYREHRPRAFLYYVFYPLLFPYWLFVKPARREFLLYKGYTLGSFAILLASQVLQYWWSFPPELGVRDFAPIAAGSFAVETIVVLMFLMPIVTTVVHYHLTGSPRRLVAVLAIGIVSVGLASWRIAQRRDPIVSYATRARVRMRTEAKPPAARAALLKALHAAWVELPRAKGDIDSDGKVEGVPLEATREALASFYKNDEAHAFDVWYTRKGRSATVVVYFEARRGHPPIWLAQDRSGAVTHDVAQLPRGAFKAMQRATE